MTNTRFYVGAFLISLLAFFSIYQPGISYFSNYKVTVTTKNILTDSLKTLSEDRAYIDSVESDFSTMNKNIASNVLMLCGKSENSDVLGKKIDSIIFLSTKNYTLSNIRELSNLKNKKLFASLNTINEQESKANQLIEDGEIPNIPLIILILVSAGILGGFSRTKFKDLAYIKKLEDDMATLVDEGKVVSASLAMVGGANAMIAPISTSHSNLQIKIENLRGAFNKATAALAVDPPTKMGKQAISILFGIIASSLAILALALTESEVLEFRRYHDYFVLWAWCVLGALYAKSWIERLHSQISNNVDS